MLHKMVNAGFTLMVMVLAGTAAADTATYEQVTFSSEVSRTLANDQMNATLAIELTDKDAGRLAQNLTLAINDALKKAAAVPTVKASSGNQSTWPVYGNSPASSGKLESWRGNAEIRLESKDFKAMGELVARLQEKLQLKGVSFSVSPERRRQAEDGMTAEAIAAFRTRADAIRSAWGAHGYRLVQMNLGTAGGPPPYVPLMRAMKAAGAEAAPAQDFAGGETSLVVNVNGTVELQP